MLEIYPLKTPKSRNYFLNKYIFINNKLTAASVIIIGVWAFVYLFLVRPNLIVTKSNELKFLLDGVIGGTGGGIIFILTGIIGKVIYRNKVVKCKNCDAINKADKYFCRNCGEKLDDDDLLKCS